MKDLLDYVNPTQGNESVHTFSEGNTLPLIARPFAMTHWAPQTEEGNRFFKPSAHQIQGIRATHQPSPWIGDYGHFLLFAQSGQRLLPAYQRASSFRIEETVIKPHFFKTRLLRYNTTLELTSTERCSILRATFPSGQKARLIVDLFEGPGKFHIDRKKNSISGYTKANSGGVPDNFALYFYLKFDFSITEYGIFTSKEILPGTDEYSGESPGAYVELTNPTEPVTARIATSFISVAQAKHNLASEVGEKKFDEILLQSQDIWSDVLQQIEIEGGTEKQLQTFYSCLYRTHLFPRVFYEYDEQGRPHHYSPYDGKLHSGVLYADNGFWDTHRTVYPLLALLNPERLSEILQGWVQAYREGGWFPKWSSPGYRACMIGTHLDAVIADGIVRGIDGFDIETAFEAMIKNANEVGDDAGNYGRRGIKAFEELGWVPHDEVEHAASRTQDFAYNDFCIAQVARILGKKIEASKYIERAKYYRNTFNPETGFMQGRLRDGSWATPFSELCWGNEYIEGSAWQCTWAVPHDAAGLIELFGGPQKTIAKLNQLMSLPPSFEVGHYKTEIHEMTEMAAVDFGQYAHSNQPVHHVLYLYTYAKAPHLTQYWVRRVLNELYNPEKFCGDEDNGEMAAWYVLSSLGIFPFCPGHPSFILSSPLFKSAIVNLKNGKKIEITTENNGPENVYIEEISLNEDIHTKADITHNDVCNGAKLHFKMTSQTPSRMHTEKDLPYSLTHE
tara:strand:+ start:1217 stop:3409 length:2193 start_codon:yes stop_codon:yes gene_type:complete